MPDLARALIVERCVKIEEGDHAHTKADRLYKPRPGSVEYWASRKPAAVAAIEEDRSLTWAEFNARADRLAAGLLTQGLRKGAIVAVRTQVRLEWMIINAALGKLKAVLLGVNWRLTPSELEYMLGDSGAQALICDDSDPAALVSTLRACGVDIAVSIGVTAPGFHAFEDLMAVTAEPRFSAADTPLIIYTSGTTGRPKGVLLGRLPDDPPPSREALEYAMSIIAVNPKGEDDAILVCMPLSHGSAPAQIRRQVQVGGRVVLARRFQPEETLKLIEQHGITSWVVVPTMLNRLAALPDAVIETYDLSSLRSIQVGAAPVSPSVKEWVIARFGEHILHEGYGSTETGMVSNLAPEMYRDKPGSCGLPYTHVHVSIRDAGGAMLKADETGEIWIKTPSTFKGYFNEPPLDRDTLDADGFFRTGDVGHVDEDGYLYITGRVKDMIVSGGVNIYPAEVEAALHDHPAVQDVAVIGIPDPEFGEQVKAFVELKPGVIAAPAELIDHVRGALASYKLPKSVEIVDELPRNLTGKVMKQELRAPYWAGREKAI